MKSGDRIGERFEIEQLAGEGGMGRVYRALDLQTKASVAVKVLSSRGGMAADRFDQEARLLSVLEHPHIVGYVAHGRTEAGQLWLAMEWLEGESLSERLSRGGLRIEEALALGRGVAAALSAAHERGVVHRDIKPSNLILVEGDPGRVKVLDFGIARVLDGERVFTQTGVAVGTPGYMAPEQARGDLVDVGARADVFSLGAVLFECVSGRPAFAATNAMALLAKLLLEEPPRLLDVRADAPPAIDALLSRMLSKDPEARPADGAAVVAEIEALGGEEGARIEAERLSPRAITGSEQRLLSVVAAVHPAEGRATALSEAAATVAADPWADHRAALRSAVASREARVEVLADGTLLLVLPGSGSATDQAARAARAALRLRTIVPGARVGVVTGRGEAKGRLPVGEILERSARLLRPLTGEAAEDSEGLVRLDETTHALLDARFDVAVAGEERLLLGEREVGEEARTLLGRPMPCVGREREIRLLRDQLAASFEEGEGARVLLVTGAAGMGKSRLRFELLKEVRQARAEVAVVVGRGDAVSAGSPFSLVGSLLRSAAGITSGEPAPAQHGKLLALCGRLPMEERALSAAFLGEIVGTPFPDEGDERLRAARKSPSLMADQIQSAYLRYMTAACDAGPVLLVLEDLHWGDAASVKLLDLVLRSLATRALVVLALARPEVHEVFPRLWSGRNLQEIRLNALSRRAAEILVRHALGQAAPEAEVSRLVERGAGHAFYLEELVRAVAEGRGEALPETVLGMVEARLSALPPEARRLLRAASVFGETFWEGGARALLGAAVPGGTREALSWLVENELLRQQRSSRFAGEAEYTFRHALLREGAYAMLPSRDLALGHRLAGAWLERSGEQDPLILAEHFEKGGDGARAAGYYGRAAERALRGLDHATAIDLAEKGIARSEDGALLSELWAIEAEARYLNGEYAQSVRAAEAALTYKGGRGECRALAFMVYGGLFLQRPDLLRASVDRLLHVDPGPEGLAAFAQGADTAIVALAFSQQREEAERCMRKLAEVIEGSAAGDVLATAWFEMARSGWARFVSRDPWAMHEHGLASVAQFERAGDRNYIAAARSRLCWSWALLGMFDDLREERARLVSSVRAGTSPVLIADVIWAVALLEQGQFEEAKALAARTAEEAGARGESFLRLNARFALAEALLRSGDLAAAEREAVALEEIGLRQRYSLPWPRAVLAEARLRAGRAEEAVEITSRALGECRDADLRHFLRHTALLLVHAEALEATGERAAAREALCEARDDVLARAAKIPDAAVRRAFLEDVSDHARALALAQY